MRVWGRFNDRDQNHRRAQPGFGRRVHVLRARQRPVDTGGIIVDQVLSDIETLNRAAFEGRYEVTAVSFHAFAHLVDKYALLPHGASMGDQYGPIVVARPGGPTQVKGSRSPFPER